MNTIKLHEKLLAIQSELKAINKEKVGGHFKNKYFDVNMLIEEIKPILTKHKVVTLQPLTHIEGKLAIETIILDGESGESLNFGPAPVTHSEDPQKMGAVITYFRRYSLVSLFLVEGEEDNDLQSGPSNEPVYVDTVDSKMNSCLVCGKVVRPPYKKCYTCNGK